MQVVLESRQAIKTVYSPTDGVEIERIENSRENRANIDQLEADRGRQMPPFLGGDHAAVAKLKGRHMTPPDELRLIVGYAEGLVGVIPFAPPTTGATGAKQALDYAKSKNLDLAGSEMKLLETLGAEIARRLFREARLSSLEVTLRKPDLFTDLAAIGLKLHFFRGAE